jgi:hypothetical protein
MVVSHFRASHGIASTARPFFLHSIRKQFYLISHARHRQATDLACIGKYSKCQTEDTTQCHHSKFIFQMLEDVPTNEPSQVRTHMQDIRIQEYNTSAMVVACECVGRSKSLDKKFSATLGSVDSQFHAWPVETIPIQLQVPVQANPGQRSC